jgi:hypothetical protein
VSRMNCKLQRGICNRSQIRSSRPDAREHLTHLDRSVYRMDCRLHAAGRMMTSTSYRQHRGAGVDELHVGEPIAHLPPDLVVS